MLSTGYTVADVLLLMLIGVVSVVLWLLRPTRRKTMLSKIPHPPGCLPIIGHAHLIKPGGNGFYELVLEFCTMFMEKEDKVFKMVVGSHNFIALQNAETVETLLTSTKHITKSAEYDYLHPWLGTGLLTSTGAKWKTRRRMLTPTFHFRILQDFLEVFNEQSKVMVERLSAKVDKGSFDIFPFITHCALDIICETAMGASVKAQDNDESDYVKAIYSMGEIIQHRQLLPWLWYDFIFYQLPMGKRHNKYLDIMHGFTEKIIKERSEEFESSNASKASSFDLEKMDAEDMLIGKRKRLAFLDMLLFAAKGENKLSFSDIREEVDTFMFEGHDTTAAAANWAMHLIGANPDVQEKLHEEMDRIFGDSDRPVTMDDMKEMKYLECVIKETLRIFPSVPFFARELMEDANIGGYDIPAHCTILVITSMLHRDERYFPDAEKFDPDRFLLENSAGRHPFAYVPFSAGLRNCIGQKFAMMEEKVMLSSIIRNYTIESTQKRGDLKPVGELILRPEGGIHVKLSKRKR